MSEKIRILGVCGLSFLFITACYFNNEEELYGPPEVDTAQVSFSRDIFPIIQMSCAVANCHVEGGFGNGVYEDYEDVYRKVENGSLMERVIVQRSMPPNDELSDEELALIEAWLEDGAPDN